MFHFDVVTAWVLNVARGRSSHVQFIGEGTSDTYQVVSDLWFVSAVFRTVFKGVLRIERQSARRMICWV